MHERTKAQLTTKIKRESCISLELKFNKRLNTELKFDKHKKVLIAVYKFDYMVYDNKLHKGKTSVIIF